jgi:tetratricopeptide (TPR) repeat protein
MILENSKLSALKSWVPTVEKLSRWAEGIKSGSVTLLALGAASISGIGVMHAVTADSVSLDPIKVPAPFEERGFTSEIATTRLLDEIATYQRKSSSAKDRVSIQGKGADDLEKLQAPVTGVNAKMIQGIVQDTLGVKKERITGEITFNKENDETVYNVRLRRVPGNHVLLDITARGEPEAVLKQTALAMIEVFDPHIAASIYWRNRDEANAMRLIDVVLNNENPSDDKYSLNLRGYIHITNKRFDAAQADFERIMRIDPKFAPAHGMAAWLQRAKGQFDASLVEADKAIEIAPTKFFGYYQKALTLREMKRDDEAESSFAKALSLSPDSAAPYAQAAAFKAARGKASEAEDIYRKGLYLFSDYAPLHAGIGELFRKQGQAEAALREFKIALNHDPKNSQALNGKADLEKSSEH